jgi:GT2 family glycosyltransferase
MKINKITSSIIIVAYEEIFFLNKTITSIIDSLIYENKVSNYEIVIVDNSKTTLVEDYLEITDFNLQIKYIRNSKNGFGTANNLGVINSEGDFLFFINPDVIVSKSFFNLVQEELDITMKCFYAPRQLDQNGKKSISYYFIDKFRLFDDLSLKFLNKIAYFNPYKMYLSGAFLIIRRVDFLNIGMFDERLFMYFEEPDLTKRLLRNYVVAKFLNNINFIHHGGGSSLSLGLKREEIRMDTLKIYCEKWGIDYIKALQELYKSAKFKSYLYSTILFSNPSRSKYNHDLMRLLDKRRNEENISS